MGYSVFPAPAVSLVPPNTTGTIVDGYSSTGTYTVPSTLSAGTYALVGSVGGVGSQVYAKTTSTGTIVGGNGTPAYFKLSSSDSAVTLNSYPSYASSSVLMNTGFYLYPGAANGLTIVCPKNNNGSNIGQHVSTDGGLTWSARTATMPSITNSGAMIYTNKYVVFGYSGTNLHQIAASSDGITFTNSVGSTFGAGGRCRSIAWNGTTYVAVGGNTTTAQLNTSTDGINWTSRTHGSAAAYIFAAVAGPGTTFFFSDSSNVLRKSTDSGVTWSTIAGSPAGIYFMIYSSTLSLYFAAANGGVYTSPDGTTWTLRKSGDFGSPQALKEGPAGTIYAFSTDNQVFYTTNGTTWIEYLKNPTATANTLVGMTYSSTLGRMIFHLESAVASGGDKTFTQIQSPAQFNLYSVSSSTLN